MDIRPVGPDALLVEVDSSADALALAGWARDRRLADDVVPGARTVLLDGLEKEVGAVSAALARWPGVAATPPGQPSSTRLVEVPVRYDGPDLAAVADAWGVAVAGVAERHAARDYVSAFCGFAPGFAYLAGLPQHASVPRLATPRERVPAGSVALAGTWCGIYPSASPGGWRLIGTTDLRLWDPAVDPPALLAPGTRVRFVPA